MASGIAIHVDSESDAVIKIISDRRFTDGGAAMLAHVNRNHHRDMIGRLAMIPFDSLSLRVWVNS